MVFLTPTDMNSYVTSCSVFEIFMITGFQILSTFSKFIFAMLVLIEEIFIFAFCQITKHPKYLAADVSIPSLSSVTCSYLIVSQLIVCWFQMFYASDT